MIIPKILMIFLPALLATAILRGDGPSVVGVESSGLNLLTNGSFELGLGAEPFYPGWRIAKTALAASEVPGLPVLDTANAHSGRQSLKLSRGRGRGVAYLDFQSPKLSDNMATHFSFWTKAGRPGVKMLFGICPEDGKGRTPASPRLVQRDLATGWQLWHCPLPARSGIVPLRVEFSSGSEESFEVWIDDVSWTMGTAFGESGERTRAGAVEVVLLPESRNDIRFADKPVVFRWSADADAKRDVSLNLTLRDLTRGGEAMTVWRGKASLSPIPSQGEIVLPEIKRGAWWAELEVRDSVSQALLGIGRERFTVMTDLHGVPAPVDFDAGYHGGIEFGDEIGFNWRGYWTLDDFFATQFQTGFRVQRDIFDWEHLEPEQGHYDWGYLDARVDAAHRNGCTTIICTPHKPLNLSQEEARKVLNNPDSGDGRWIYQTATDISGHAVRSTPMGGSGDPAKRNRLFAPDPKALSDFMTTLAARYRGKIDAIEFLNEPNLYIDPVGLIEYYFKPAYAAMKKVAPDLPVLMNQTMDFAADGNGYTGQFLKLGGFDYSDGVFHHPYGVSQLEENGLEGVKTLEQLVEIYSKPGKKMLLGMSEIHGLGGSSRAFIRGEVVQRAFLDWAVGCRWSAGGLLTRQSFYEGTGPRHWFLRGASAPGVGSVHMNALYSTLGGYRFLRRIELDDNVLILALEKADAKPGEERYAVAIEAAQLPLTVSMLETKLEGIAFSAFDFTGEPVKLSSLVDIQIGNGTLYLRSNDARLLDRLQAGRVSWAQNISGEIEERLGPEAETTIYATGLPPRKPSEVGVINRWAVLSGIRDSGAHGKNFPVDEKITTRSGELVWPVDQARMVDQPQPYVLLAGGNPAEIARHYAHTSIHASQAGEITAYFSATGPAILWLNGTTRIELSDMAYGLVGQEWRPIKFPLVAGMNHILVQVASQGAPCAFALSASREATNNASLTVDDEGFIRKWRIIGPWKNWRNAEGKYQGNAKAFPPEQGVNFLLNDTGLRKMPLIWHAATYATPVIPHPWVDGISYAFTVVEVTEDTPCLASLGSDDGFVLWINGQLVGRNAASRALKVDSDKLPVLLKKGRNQVLFKIDDTGGAGSFTVRFVHEDGRPVRLGIVD
ncbi:MAG: beta-galactosidase [Opitutaceae bacterium]|jgi:hypothetical protein